MHAALLEDEADLPHGQPTVAAAVGVMQPSVGPSGLQLHMGGE